MIVPGLSDFSQWNYVRVDAEPRRFEGGEDALDRCQQPRQGNALVATTHQDDRGGAESSSRKLNVTTARASYVDKPHRCCVIDRLGNGDNDRLSTFPPQIIDHNIDPCRELFFQRCFILLAARRV